MEIFFAILIVLVITTAIAAVSMAPWVPTRKSDLERALKLADIQPNQIFYELGCGNGVVCFYFAQNTQAQVTGFELSLFFYFISKIRQIFGKDKNIEIKLKNIFKQDLSEADVIYVFGMEESLAKKLRKKLQAELKPGSKVISYTFPINGLEPSVIDRPTPDVLPIYLYEL